MSFIHPGRNSTMTALTRTIRLAVFAAAVLAIMAPVAQAHPSGTGGYAGTYRPSNGEAPLTQDLLSRRGPVQQAEQRLGSWQTQIATQQPPPDRVDRIGTTEFSPFKTPVVVATGSEGFDWASAVAGALAAVAIVLIGAAAISARGRRRVVLSA
jgi:hypothetical protein